MFIKIENLESIYGEGTVFKKTALKNINLEIKKGEFVGLIGHTGSGKSTLIQHLNSLIKPSKGKIIINGIDINENKKTIKENRKRVGLVFQYPEHQLFETTIYEDVAFGVRKLGLDKKNVDKSVRDALQLLGISEEIFEKSPFEVSGGQKRKVALAGIIAMKPEILVLDEPTAGLDPKSRNEFLVNLKKMQENLNLTVILVSHSMSIVAKYADRLIVMNEGEVIFHDTPSAVFKEEEALIKIGLDIPEERKLVKKLNELGCNIGDNVIDIDEIVEKLRKVLK